MAKKSRNKPKSLVERKGILAGGNWVLDRIKIIDSYPAQDHLANILKEGYCNGGAPFNVLKDLSRLCVPFSLEGVGLVGKDPSGDWILEECAKHKIRATQVRRTGHAPTSTTEVMTVKSTGRRTFFHSRGANALLGPKHFSFQSTEAKIFHLGYLLLLDRLDQIGPAGKTGASVVLANARLAGLITSIDLASEESMRNLSSVKIALPQVDICFCNEFEAGQLTGISPRRGTSLIGRNLVPMGQRILRLGVRKIVFLHFPEGAVAIGSDGQAWFQSSLRVPARQQRGTVGAGDAFAAGVLYAWHEGKSPEEALFWGICVAASSVLHSSTSDGIQSLPACLKLAKKFGFKENIRH